MKVTRVPRWMVNSISDLMSPLVLFFFGMSSTCLQGYAANAAHRSMPVLEEDRYVHNAAVAIISVTALNPFCRPKNNYM